MERRRAPSRWWVLAGPQKLKSFTIGAVSLLFAAIIWTQASRSGDPSVFPTPHDVAAAFVQVSTRGYAGGTLVMHVLHSVELTFLGFLAATVVGLPIGLLMGIDRRIDAALEPVLAVLRPVPPLAWVPIAIIWFGLGDAAKVFVVFFTAVVPVLINSYSGARNVDRTLVAAALVHGADGVTLIRSVIFPGALPTIFTGLRVALQAAWMTVVAAELVGAFFGLGRVLSIAGQDIYPGMIVVAMLCVAATAACMNKALLVAETVALPWLRPQT